MSADPRFKRAVRRVMCLSTVHISEKTANALVARAESLRNELDFRPMEAGFEFVIPSVEAAAAIGLTGYPDLCRCLLAARQENCDYLELDADGAVVDHLVSYEW